MATATAVVGTTDETTRQTVLHQINREPDVDASGVGVTVDNGLATLTGTAGSYAEKLAIERAVRCVAGVRGVANAIQVTLAVDHVKRLRTPLQRQR